jgi:hypothetical protein
MKAAAFEIYCDLQHSEFTLARERNSWRKKFSNLEAALAFASDVATESTRLDVYNALGEMIIQSTVEPLSKRHGKAVLGSV